jgi:hypothetical protein
VRPDALRALEAYPWPGNIRELRNVLYETLVYKRAGTEILLSDLPRRILARGTTAPAEPSADRSSLSRKIAGGTMNLRAEVAALERMAIEEALSRTGATRRPHGLPGRPRHGARSGRHGAGEDERTGLKDKAPGTFRVRRSAFGVRRSGLVRNKV